MFPDWKVLNHNTIISFGPNKNLFFVSQMFDSDLKNTPLFVATEGESESGKQTKFSS